MALGGEGVRRQRSGPAGRAAAGDARRALARAARAVAGAARGHRSRPGAAVRARGGWFVWQLYRPGGDGAPVQVDVQQGWGAKEIGDELANKDVVGSSLAFQLWFRGVGGTTSQAGTYDAARAHGRARGRAPRCRTRAPATAEHHTLALPPGLRLEQIADRVGAAARARPRRVPRARGSRVRCARSTSRRPDVGRGLHLARHVLRRRADRRAHPRAPSCRSSTSTATPSASATPRRRVSPRSRPSSLASLVQAEADRAPTRPRSRRSSPTACEQGTPLQIDATLCYAKGGCPPVPNNADKQLDSPYNTYRVTRPAAHADHDRHRAVAAAPRSHPANVPYLFYVTGKDGVTRFATTLAEHEQNIAAHGVSGE